MVRQFFVCLATPRNFACSPFSRVEGDIARGNLDCFSECTRMNKRMPMPIK